MVQFGALLSTRCGSGSWLGALLGSRTDRVLHAKTISLPHSYLYSPSAWGTVPTVLKGELEKALPGGHTSPVVPSQAQSSDWLPGAGPVFSPTRTPLPLTWASELLLTCSSSWGMLARPGGAGHWAQYCPLTSSGPGWPPITVPQPQH